MKMRRSFGSLMWLLSVALPAHAADSRPMTPRDIIALRQVSDPRISPDGSLVVFVVTELDEQEHVYQSDLWLVGAHAGDPRRLTYHPKNDRSPTWSPDGHRIAFLSERQEKAQIFVMDGKGGEARRLTDAKEGVSALTWSPDGKSIAYVTADPPSEEDEKRKEAKDDERVVDEDFQMAHLWKTGLEGKDPVRLTQGAFTLSDPQWSPDGLSIAAVRRPNPKADDARFADIVLVPAEGGEPRRLYANEGPDTSPRWSPDGRWIAFVSREGHLDPRGNSRLYVIAAEGGNPRPLTGLQISPSAPVWSSDGRTLWFDAGSGVRGGVFSVPFSGGDVRPEIEGAFYADSATASQNGDLAFLRQDPLAPPDVWARKPGGSPVQRTRFNTGLQEISLGKFETIRWKSTDGLEIEGIVFLPPGAPDGQPYPLLVEAHGGPSGAYTLTFPGSWGRYAHCYTGRGWAVFQPNFRGSSNYGDDFLRLNTRDWGRGDFQDILSGVDTLIKKGVADRQRMAFHGWSYGGYMTAWTITQTERFKAAACGAGLTNLVSMYGTNDIPRTLADYFGGEPWNALDLYHGASAMYHIRSARTPTLILHGEKDDRVPIGQAQELYLGLKQNGVPVKMVVYPREPHGLREPNHQLDKMEREMAWFEKYVLASGASPAGRNRAGAKSEGARETGRVLGPSEERGPGEQGEEPSEPLRKDTEGR